jgi:hypothetical protein
MCCLSKKSKNGIFGYVTTVSDIPSATSEFMNVAGNRSVDDVSVHGQALPSSTLSWCINDKVGNTRTRKHTFPRISFLCKRGNGYILVIYWIRSCEETAVGVLHGCLPACLAELFAVTQRCISWAFVPICQIASVDDTLVDSPMLRLQLMNRNEGFSTWDCGH